MREKLYIATKTPAQTGEDFWKDLETSLKLLRTDYVDLYQFHNPDFCPKPGDGTGLYEAMLEAKAQGKVRHIGITNHRLHVAQEAIDSGLYETLQFPFSYLSSDKELDLVRQCREKDMGFIAMKALAGGTINNSSAAYAYMLQFDNVLPIWGIQRGWELKEFLNYEKQPPALDDGLRAVIEKDRRELAGNFCRGCGYCMPCPQGIEINQCARMSLMLRRAPTQAWLTKEWQEKMEQITSCVHCNQCASKCPYGLDTPALLLENSRITGRSWRESPCEAHGFPVDKESVVVYNDAIGASGTRLAGGSRSIYDKTGGRHGLIKSGQAEAPCISHRSPVGWSGRLLTSNRSNPGALYN